MPECITHFFVSLRPQECLINNLCAAFEEVWGLTIKLVQQLDIAVENLHLSGCACLLKIAWGAKSDASAKVLYFLLCRHMKQTKTGHRTSAMQQLASVHCCLMTLHPLPVSFGLHSQRQDSWSEYNSWLWASGGPSFVSCQNIDCQVNRGLR